MIGLLKSAMRFVVLIATCLIWFRLYSWAAYTFFYPPGTALSDDQALARFEWGLPLSTAIVCLLMSWLLAKLLPSARTEKAASRIPIAPTGLRAAVALILIPILVSVFVGQRIIRNTPWGDVHHLLQAIVIEVGVGALLGLGLYWRVWSIWRARTQEPPQVWFSTEHQFEAFRNAVSSGNWWRRIIGRYPIADGAAYASALPWMKTPLVLVARGELLITDTAIKFSPISGRAWSNRRYHNVMDEFRFEVPFSDIVSIAAEEVPIASFTTDEVLSDLISRYWLPWTRVMTSRPAPLNEFFLAVGGRNRNAMQCYRELSLGLRDRLVKAIGARGAPTP
jgi:hypothetical protein